MPPTYDLLVIGAGPAGAATAYWAAQRGAKVVAVEKQTFPRDKTCGDGLTPRAVKELDDMGLADNLARCHRHQGLRVRAHNSVMELPWPSHPEYPDFGYVVRRRELDDLLAQHAKSAGAEIWFGCEAVKPLLDEAPAADAAKANGTAPATSVMPAQAPLLGAQVRDKASKELIDIQARCVVVADGANSRFGRALGCRRNRSLAQGMAIRTYFQSPAAADTWIESALDIRDRRGNALPGYGWIFPLGDGSINAGIGLLSTFRDYKNVNTSWLMDEWAHALPDYWQIDPTAPEIPPVGGRLPMGGSVSPKAGPNWLVVGDAAGTINPFNGEGIDYAYETGRAAANFALASLSSATTPTQLADDYQIWLADTYELYFKVGQLFARAIGRPEFIQRLIQVGMKSQTLMEWALRIMANLLRPHELKPAEMAYAAMKGIARLAPESPAT